MSDYPAAAGVTRQNILARLLGSPDALAQLQGAPMLSGPQMTQGDPRAAPFFLPQQQMMALPAPQDQRRNLLAMLLERMQR